MGNIQQQQQQLGAQNSSSSSSSSSPERLGKHKFYRFLGIRLANEGDGYEDEKRALNWKLDRLNEQLRKEEYPKSVTLAALPSAELAEHKTQAPAKTSKLRQPGTVAELHRCCHDMLPQCFEGFRLNVSRALGHSSVAVGHMLQVGHKPQLAACQFNVSYSGDSLQPSSGESYPLLLGELDARGNATATVMHYLTQRLRGKFTAHIADSALQSSRLFFDYFGDTFSCTCVLSNIDVQQRMGVFVASYLQQLTPRLALGLDFIYQREDIVPGGQAALLSAVGRYQEGNKQWSAMFSLNALELCYSQIYGENLGASVQLQVNILKRQAISRLCYHCYMSRLCFSFRGGIDTRGVISAVCEKRLEPLPVVLELSAKMNHVTNRFRFGLGLVMG
ncbi:mitochondrial import receptor subunit TOM40 homolog 1-like [Drosophila busckii]|uniref:mitochondrial import receptor subunit TOM40 homolog 1-like n=1 Tax=Drosophila busckii TaxID=30019 RepID=UPI0014328665|nr:mitochondrial import receptor subunit TOM40 homolog 1-like [Drosophila busckii]